jgi:hypothetical protein
MVTFEHYDFETSGLGRRLWCFKECARKVSCQDGPDHASSSCQDFPLHYISIRESWKVTRRAQLFRRWRMREDRHSGSNVITRVMLEAKYRSDQFPNGHRGTGGAVFATLPVSKNTSLLVNFAPGALKCAQIHKDWSPWPGRTFPLHHLSVLRYLV